MKPILGIVVLILDILAIMDCLKSGRSNGQKILWVVIIVCLPLIGLIAYYLLKNKT